MGRRRPTRDNRAPGAHTPSPRSVRSSGYGLARPSQSAISTCRARWPSPPTPACRGCAYVCQQAGDRVHFWPFGGWDIPVGRSVVAEVYPSPWRRSFAREGRNADPGAGSPQEPDQSRAVSAPGSGSGAGGSTTPGPFRGSWMPAAWGSVMRTGGNVSYGPGASSGASPIGTSSTPPSSPRSPSTSGRRPRCSRPSGSGT